MTKRWFLLVACSVVLLPSLGAQEALRDVRTPGFRVTLDKGGTLRVWYLDLPLVTGSSFQVSSKDWKNVVPGRAPKLRVAESREGGTRILKIDSGIKGKGTCAATVSLTAAKLRIVNEFSIEPASEGTIFYTECFLSRETLAEREFMASDGVTGILKTGGNAVYSSGLKRLELPTELGKLTIAVSESYTVAGAKASQAWEFRSVCDRPWGADDQRTFTLMNVHTLAEPQAASGKTEYEFTFEPSDDIAAKLAERRGRLVAARDAKMVELAALAVARQARIKEAGGVVLYPTPQRYKRLPGEFAVTNDTVIVVPDGASEVERRGPERLREELAEYRGLDLQIVAESKWSGQGSAIQVGTALARKALAGRVDSTRKEGFSLSMTKDRVLLAGTDAAGTWYGVQALLQLPRWQERALVMPCVEVDDWPDFAVRGMTLTLGSPRQMYFLRHTLRRVLPRQRVNMVFIGGASLGKIRWPSHPDAVTGDAFTPAQIRELAELARANFIEPVPHIQGFGHTGPLVRTRPDLLAAKGGSQPCFDITRKDVRAFIFDLYADAIDAFQAKQYFHVGFDEAKGLSLICGDRSHAEVVAEHITEVNGWLNKRGLRMIMWADMLLDHETFGKSSAANSMAPHYGNVNTAPALAMIPKNILLANWHYGTAEEHPQLAHLQEAGFEVFPTTWYRPENNFRFLRSAKKAGSTWATGSSWMYCSATNPTMMGSSLGEYAWTAGRPTLDQLNYDELALFHDLLQPPRVSGRPHRQQAVDLAGVANRDLLDRIPGDGKGWLDLGPSRDLSAVQPGRLESTVHDRMIAFTVPGKDSARCVMVQGKKLALGDVPPTAVVPVGARAEALVFLHAGTADHSGTGPAGMYQVVYEDGSTVDFALRNSLHVAGWLKPKSYGSWRTARQQTYCRDATLGWRGLTLDGRTAELSLTEWRNPKPTSGIREIRLSAPVDGALALMGLTILSGL